uniref:Uncharacterized protein n=1 Tax=Brassica oleracea TaxID=3712 RepID=A0A3P6E8H9_BRAOL|nr:unnamed protein product [Brassica oleracea]
MDWPCSKSNSGTLIRQATGSRRRSLFVFFFFPKLLHPRRIGSFAFLRRSSAPSHFPSLASSSYSLRFISFSCTGEEACLISLSCGVDSLVEYTCLPSNGVDIVIASLLTLLLASLLTLLLASLLTSLLLIQFTLSKYKVQRI